MPPESPDLVVGRYRVLREIGRGGMGSVWLCLDERLGREVAVKQLGGLPGESSPHVARALREARSSAALHHPHVVAIFDAVEDGERVWLVMEHLPSRNLSQLIAEQGPIEPRRLAAIVAQVAEGLAAAHERGTVHRDVKPGNILVTDADLAKISDFGIARTLGDEQLTQTGMVMGTPLYFSPQLARGADPVAADDVWALGATLYYGVEGEPPWPHRSNAIALLTHIATEDPPTPTRAGPLADVIARMMDPRPDRRPSMSEVAEELRAVAEGRYGGLREPEDQRTVPVPAPAPALAPTPGGSDGRPRRRGAVVGALAVLLLVVGGLAAWLGLRDDDEGPAAGAEQDPPAATASPDRAPSGGDAPSDGAATPAETPGAETPSSSPSAEDPAGDAPAGDAERFVTDYYALLPDDPDAAWRMLAPSYQESVGRDAYTGFWGTIGAVRVAGTESAGEGRVDVTLTYDGGQQETRRITVAEEGGSPMIVADEVLG